MRTPNVSHENVRAAEAVSHPTSITNSDRQNLLQRIKGASKNIAKFFLRTVNPLRMNAAQTNAESRVDHGLNSNRPKYKVKFAVATRINKVKKDKKSNGLPSPRKSVRAFEEKKNIYRNNKLAPIQEERSSKRNNQATEALSSIQDESVAGNTAFNRRLPSLTPTEKLPEPSETHSSLKYVAEQITDFASNMVSNFSETIYQLNDQICSNIDLGDFDAVPLTTNPPLVSEAKKGSSDHTPQKTAAKNPLYSASLEAQQPVSSQDKVGKQNNNAGNDELDSILGKLSVSPKRVDANLSNKAMENDDSYHSKMADGRKYNFFASKMDNVFRDKEIKNNFHEFKTLSPKEAASIRFPGLDPDFNIHIENLFQQMTRSFTPKGSETSFQTSTASNDYNSIVKTASSQSKKMSLLERSVVNTFSQKIVSQIAAEYGPGFEVNKAALAELSISLMLDSEGDFTEINKMSPKNAFAVFEWYCQDTNSSAFQNH